jgi:hypothetical protein
LVQVPKHGPVLACVTLSAEVPIAALPLGTIDLSAKEETG